MFNHNSRNYNGYIIDPTTGIVYLYNSARGGEFVYEEPVMNGREYSNVWNKIASEQDDFTAISDIYYNTKVPGEEYTYEDLVKGLHQDLKNAKEQKDLNRIAAVITSKDYGIFQTPTLVSTTSSTIRTGVLTGLFEEIATPQLSYRYGTLVENLTWHTNVPEGTTVDPSAGGASYTDIFVSKHEGAVSETFRARMVLAGNDPLARLTQRLGQERLKKENAMVASEIEGNVANTEAGVDFGARTGSPPESTTSPLTLWNTLITKFDGYGKGNWNTIVSKAFIYNEYITNDIVRGVNNPIPTQMNVNESSGPVPALSGITWVRDNAITSATGAWAMDTDLCIKNFRGPTTSFTVESQERETTKNVIRTYFKTETVDTDMIVYLSNVAA